MVLMKNKERQHNRHKQSANGLFFHLPADSVGTWGSKACSIPSSTTFYNSKKLCETKKLYVEGYKIIKLDYKNTSIKTKNYEP